MGLDKSEAEPDGLLPIPTYEEATSSRPSSSQSYLGPAEISADAERQRLLDRDDTSAPPPSRRPNGYHPPTVESARSSAEFLPDLAAEHSARNSVEALRREISEMDVDDAQAAAAAGRSGSSARSKRVGGFRLPTFRLPTISQWLPSSTFLSSVRARLAELPNPLKPVSGILLIRLLALLFVLSLGYLVFFTRVFRRRGDDGQSFPLASVRAFVRGQINQTKIVENLQHASQWDHIAGTEGSFYLAKWIEGEMQAAGMDRSTLEQFDVYLNYPKKDGRRVAIVDPVDKRWEAKIEEEKVYSGREQTTVFHGYSKSGSAKGPLIYVNYGSKDDFKKLKAWDVDIKGAIVLVRYGGSNTDRALKVKNAELAGAVGCIIYSDPQEDGYLQGKTYPEGRFRPADSVQRGTVGITSWLLGDPLSPGFASHRDEPRRAPKEDNPGLNKIPSIPLAWRDAEPLLQALQGHGHKLAENEWKSRIPNLEWWTGDQKSPIVNLVNEQYEVERQPIYNVLGVIDGREQQNPIIVGNHYDAWCFGAVDPGSGIAVFVELLRVFGELRKEGWRPRRTIEFAAWDGEEYGMVGSTEHVEARQDELRQNAFAYINVDVAVQGNNFTALGSPMLEKALTDVLKRVRDPSKGSKSLFDIWQTNEKKLEGLSAGSDYAAFQNIVGVSSIDLTFGGPPYPFHSCYESFDWMARFGDPTFLYHRLLAEVWALMILALADEPLLPFDLEAYAKAIDGYVLDLQEFSSEQAGSGSTSRLNLKSLEEASSQFNKVAKRFHDWGRAWQRSFASSGGLESTALMHQRQEHNRKMAKFEADLLDMRGLPGREQFKHVIFAPQAWSGYDAAYFPGPRDAIDAGDWQSAQAQVDKIGEILKTASGNLLG